MRAITAAFADPERRKVVLSLVLNILTRFPSIVMVFIVLPRFFRGLGAETYNLMFATLAIGNLVTFLIYGSGVFGIRLIGEAVSTGDEGRQADGFVSVVVVNTALMLLLSVALTGYIELRGETVLVVMVGLLPILQAWTNSTFDNARLAFNEHYVTALIWFGVHMVWYAMALTMDVFRTNIVLAASVINGPITVAGILNGLYLVVQRRYLLRGRPALTRAVLRGGAPVGVADAMVLAPLSLVVIWFEIVAPVAVTSWFATVIRLFMMSLTPLMLVLIPLTGFVRLKWGNASGTRQRQAIWVGLGLGAFIGVGLAGFLAIVAPFYVEHWLHLPVPGPWLVIAPLFALFGTIACFKCYSSLAYVVLDGTALASGLIVALSMAGLLGVAATFLFPPLTSFAIFATAATALIFAVQFRSARSNHAALTI